MSAAQHNRFPVIRSFFIVANLAYFIYVDRGICNALRGTGMQVSVGKLKGANGILSLNNSVLDSMSFFPHITCL
jgi:hypothetical protein